LNPDLLPSSTSTSDSKSFYQIRSHFKSKNYHKNNHNNNNSIDANFTAEKKKAYKKTRNAKRNKLMKIIMINNEVEETCRMRYYKQENLVVDDYDSGVDKTYRYCDNDEEISEALSNPNPCPVFTSVPQISSNQYCLLMKRKSKNKRYSNRRRKNRQPHSSRKIRIRRS
jgi:hypothetical protein